MAVVEDAKSSNKRNFCWSKYDGRLRSRWASALSSNHWRPVSALVRRSRATTEPLGGLREAWERGSGVREGRNKI